MIAPTFKQRYFHSVSCFYIELCMLYTSDTIFFLHILVSIYVIVAISFCIHPETYLDIPIKHPDVIKKANFGAVCKYINYFDHNFAQCHTTTAVQAEVIENQKSSCS